MKILLLEDDIVLSNILADYLSESYEVVHTYTQNEALKLSEKFAFDLYIFDINVPDGDGISLLKELRSFNDSTPAIFITAFHDTKHLKDAFESGGNDFIRKPFELEELTQRIENIKRYFGFEELIQIEKDIRFDAKSHLLKKGATSYAIAQKESDLLLYMYKNRHRVVSVEEILQNIWEYDKMPSSDAVRTLIKDIRLHIGKEHIVNVRGVGYKYE